MCDFNVAHLLFSDTFRAVRSLPHSRYIPIICLPYVFIIMDYNDERPVTDLKLKSY